MKTPRQDWLNLKNQFMCGQWLTVADFFRELKIKDNSRNRLHTKGWINAREAHQEEVASRARERIIEKEVDIRLRQQQLAKRLQHKGLQGLEQHDIYDSKTALQCLVSGLHEEREALGLNDKKESTGISKAEALPNTELDRMFEEMSYEELLELIAELKHMKQYGSEIVVEK
jgi:hypothetical protein